MAPETNEQEIVLKMLGLTHDHLDFQLFVVFPSILKEEKEFITDGESLWNAVHPQFEKVSKAVYNMRHEDLELAGLSGSQLLVKWKWLTTLMKRVASGWNRVERNVPVGLLKAVSQVINSFLGSLGTIVPGVEPIKELKEYLESGLELV